MAFYFPPHVKVFVDSTCFISSAWSAKYVGFIFPWLNSFSAWSSKCLLSGWSLLPSGRTVHDFGGFVRSTTCVDVCPPRPTNVGVPSILSKPIARGVAIPSTDPPPTGHVFLPPLRPTR